MTKKFFTKATPKAAEGIRRLYERKGYEVRSKLQTDGTVTVVAMKDGGAKVSNPARREEALT